MFQAGRRFNLNSMLGMEVEGRKIKFVHLAQVLSLSHGRFLVNVKGDYGLGFCVLVRPYKQGFEISRFSLGQSADIWWEYMQREFPSMDPPQIGVVETSSGQRIRFDFGKPPLIDFDRVVAFVPIPT